MKASDVFPKGMAESVCVNFTCKGRECTRENCTFVHPSKVCDLKKETVNAIGKHFLEKRAGWFNEWHFLKVANELPENSNNSWEERMAVPALMNLSCH
jgi:hypothetical protein